MRLFKLHALHSLTLIVAVLLSAASLPLTGASVSAQNTAVLDGKLIYITESNRETSFFDRSDQGLSHLGGILQRLGAEVLPLDWRRDIPNNADLVIIAGPTRRFEAGQVGRLWAYLNNGGSLLVLSDPLIVSEGDNGLETQLNTAIESNRGIFELTWPDLGVRGRDDIVLPNEGNTNSEVLSMSPPSQEEQSRRLAFTTGNVGAGHAVTDSIAQELVFFGARSVQYDSSIQRFRATPLIFAPDSFYGETEYSDYLDTGFAPTFSSGDTTNHTLALAAAAENPTMGTRIVVIGDLDFATNGSGLRTSPPNSSNFEHPENVQFLINAVAWLMNAETASVADLLADQSKPTRTPAPTLSLTPLSFTAEATVTATPVAESP